MAEIISEEPIAGFEAPVHRSLTEPILLAGAPRAVAIINGTVSAALGLGLRLWIAGLVFWAIGHMAAVWAAKRDPFFVEVVRRHVRYPAHSVQVIMFNPSEYRNKPQNLADFLSWAAQRFIIGTDGKTSELVNYRVRNSHMIVDRLFAAAELHLGGKGSERRIRIVRNDGRLTW